MASKTTSHDAAGAAAESAAQTMEQLQGMSEKVLSSANAAGHATLDAYDKAVAQFVDLELKAADATQLDWMSTIAGAHTSFIFEVSGAYTKAARSVLN